jgi:hypothetical protein
LKVRGIGWKNNEKYSGSVLTKNSRKQRLKEESNKWKLKYGIDFSLWKRMDYWYLNDGICLLINENPDYYAKRDKNTLPSSGLRILKVAERTIWRDTDGTLIPNKGLDTLLPPRVFLVWALKKKFGVPPELESLVEEKTPLSPQQSAKDKTSQQNANKRWAPHKALLNKAGKLAQEKWKAGDEALHNEMADYILGRREFSPLINKRASLLKHLKPIGKKYGRVRGLKGSFRNK